MSYNYSFHDLEHLKRGQEIVEDGQYKVGLGSNSIRVWQG